MRVYLDACCLQRPLDDRSQPRVNVEAEAVLTVLRLVENGDLDLVSSDALEFEIDRIPDTDRLASAREILKHASEIVRLNEFIESEAESLVNSGFKALDALHLASAANGGVEYFCTCDDKLRKKAVQLGWSKINVVSPLELADRVAP